MISALLTGDLVADPVKRSTRDGKPFMTATVRVPAGADALFVGLACFSEVGCERLVKLRKGATVAAVGTLEATTWADKAGDERRGWRLTATEVLSVYEATKRRSVNDQRPSSEALRAGDPRWIDA